MGTFIGNSDTTNIMHLTTGTRTVTDQQPRTDTIFHSQLPHIFIIEEVAQSLVGYYGSCYDVFSFANDIITNWESQGYVYLLKVTYSDGRVRLLNGSSSIQTGYWVNRVSGPYQEGILSYFQHPSMDAYQQVFWMGSATTNIDQEAQRDICSPYQFAFRAAVPLGTSDPMDQCVNALNGVSSTQYQVDYGPYSKKYLAIGRTRRWPDFTLPVPSSNYETGLAYAGSPSTAYQKRLSPMSYSGSDIRTRSSSPQVTKVSQLRLNMKFTSNTFSQVRLNSDTGEIKISNNAFIIGGLDFRNTPYDLITQYTSSSPQMQGNYQGTQKYAWDPNYLSPNYGFNQYSFPTNGSWELNSNIPSISSNGQVIWSDTNIPLRFLSQFSVSLQRTNIPLKTTPHQLATINTGQSQGHMQQLLRYSSTEKRTFYPGQYHGVGMSSSGTVFFINPPDNGGINVPPNFGLINMPVGQYIPLLYICGGGTDFGAESSYTITIWQYNNNSGQIIIYSTVSFPSSVLLDSRTIPGPAITIHGARLL